MLAKIMGLLLLGLIRVLTGAQARWVGCPPKAEQRIYFANHQSHADLLLIWAALPQELRPLTRPIAARDYWTLTPFRHWLTREVFNAIYVTRDRQSAQVAAGPPQGDLPPSGGGLGVAQTWGPSEDPLEPLVEALSHGDSIILFPEGTRGHAEEPQVFKAGLYNLAMRFPSVVLVPTWIHNVQRVMPKGEVVPVPVLCSVTFGAPIRVEEGEERRAFLTRAREAVMALREV